MNNHYLLQDNATGLWYHIPWGTDQTFQCQDHNAFDGCKSMNQCLDDAACRSEHDSAAQALQEIDTFRVMNCFSVPTIVLDRAVDRGVAAVDSF